MAEGFGSLLVVRFHWEKVVKCICVTDMLAYVQNTQWFKKAPPLLPYSYDFSFYKSWPVSIIFGTWCIDLIFNITVIDLPISPTYCCYTTLGNINCCTVLGKTVCSVPAQRACHMIELLQRETPKFILWTFGLRIVLILVLFTVEYGAWRRIVCIKRQFETWSIWDSTWSTYGIACCRALWTMLLTNDGRDFRPVWMKRTFWTFAIVMWTWTWTGCADKLDVVLYCTTVMCNFGRWDWKL